MRPRWLPPRWGQDLKPSSVAPPTATVTKAEAGSLPEGKVRIRLEGDGAVLDVDEEDVEKANPPCYDRCQDLASLLYLNESSVMHSLRQRYGGNLIYTHAGPNLVVVNPVSTPSMYSEKVTPPPSRLSGPPPTTGSYAWTCARSGR